MIAFRKVTPALKMRTLCRSIIEAKRPACGNTGDPSDTNVVTRVISGAQIR